MDSPALILFGPTASGKTGILLELFSAGSSPLAEVISADSMQVYRGMDIGTAKPTAEEQARLPHHLLDIRNPDEQFNAGDFVRLAAETCRDISGRGKLPVISGGTGFYLKNFILGLPSAPPSNPLIREELRQELKEKGVSALMEELERRDPLSAQRIHINDQYRLLRALEVLRLSGRSLSSFQVPSAGDADTAGNAKAQSNFLIIGLQRPREELYRRIEMRCDNMFRQGLVDEVRSLYNCGYTPKDPGLRAIGYHEFFVEDLESPVFSENKKKYRFSEDISGVQALVVQNSRRYAKRQITFFSGIPGIKWIEAGDDNVKTVRQIRREMGEQLAVSS